MISSETKQRWQDILDGAGEIDDKLNDWEREFIDSLMIRIGEGKELSWKQSQCLHKIAEKYHL